MSKGRPDARERVDTAPVDPGALAAWRRPHQRREPARPRRKGVIGKRGVVGGQDGLGHGRRGRSLHEQAWAEGRQVLGEVLVVQQHLVDGDRSIAVVVHRPGQPAGQRGLRGMQRRIGCHDTAGQTGTRRQGAQADRSAPVLDDERHALKPERVGELCGPVDVGLDRVGRRRHRLVRATEADQVGGDDPQAMLDQPGDHLPVEVGPRRLSVQQQDRPASGGGLLVDIVHAQPLWQADVTGFEGISGQVTEPCIGRAQHLHGAQCAPTRRVCWTRCP